MVSDSGCEECQECSEEDDEDPGEGEREAEGAADCPGETSQRDYKDGGETCHP